MAARYVYSCSKCGGPVHKDPVAGERDKDGGFITRAGLGGWKCDAGCVPVKVQRILRKSKEKDNA